MSQATRRLLADRLRQQIHVTDTGEVEPSVRDFFAEEPVDLTTFVRDKKFLNSPRLSDIQYDAVRHLEQIYLPETYPGMVEEFGEYWSPVRFINLAYIQWGKGSGKDSICRIANARAAYLLLCLKSPQDYFGMPPQDEIQTLNVAASASQAHRAFFRPLATACRRSPWFANNLMTEPSDQSISIRFKKQIEMVSGHSMADTMEGLNLIFAIADEISAFKTKEELERFAGVHLRDSPKSSDAILRMLRTSAATRFPKNYKMAAISFPRFKGDAIQQLCQRGKEDNEAKAEKSRVYVSGPFATWDVNPRIESKDDFAEDYDEDPDMAEAMYECAPKLSPNRYFKNEEAIYAALDEDKRCPVRIEYYWGQEQDPQMRAVKHGWQVRFHFDPEFRPVQGACYAIHGDLAISGDRAGIAMSHVRTWRESEIDPENEESTQTPVEKRPVIKNDFTTAFEADASAMLPDGISHVAREVQVRWARQLVQELVRRKFVIGLVTFDNFQCLSGDTKIPLLNGTTKTMQELEGSSPFWVYSIKNGRVVPGLCTRAWRTNALREDMVEVEMDNGEIVKSTSDHRFMLRDGSYRRAEDLVSGDSMMPLYRRQRPLSQDFPEYLYEQVWHPEADGSGKRWKFTHSTVSHYCYGKLPKGWVTHHVNVDRMDNRPENLRQMTTEAHSQLHAEMARGRFTSFWDDPEWSAAHRQRLSLRRTAEQTGVVGVDSRAYKEDISFEEIQRVAVEIAAQGQHLRWRDLADRFGYSQGPIYARIRAAGYSSWKEFKWSVQPQTSNALKQIRYRQANNHKVVAVRQSVPEAVYDLQVEEHHNFAVGAGVFVHNSADSIQILETWGIESRRESMDRSVGPWACLRDVMYDGRLESHYSPLLRDELLGLTKLSNGKVDHPQGGSKDLADSLAGSVLGAIELGGDETDDPQYADLPGGFSNSVSAPPESPRGERGELAWLSNGGFDIPEALVGANSWRY